MATTLDSTTLIFEYHGVYRKLGKEFNSWIYPNSTLKITIGESELCRPFSFFSLIYLFIFIQLQLSAFSPLPSTPPQPVPPPSPTSTPWVCPCVLYSSSWKSLSPLSPPHSPLAIVSVFLISMSLGIFCLLFSFVDYVPVKGEIICRPFLFLVVSHKVVGSTVSISVL